VERSGSGDDETGMRNVLLIVVDCLRADRVIGPRPCQTPVLEQLGPSREGSGPGGSTTLMA
jgi:hypothetical protein